MKKLLFAALCVLMLVTTVIPLGVFAQNVSGICGDSLTWSFNASRGTLEISGSGDMYDYKPGSNYTNAAPWSEYSYDITKVIIGDGVTSVGEYAFYDCGKLDDVTPGNTLERIGAGAFDETRMWRMDIPVSVKYIGSASFPVSDWTPFDIYYQGSEEQWADVTLDLSDYDLCYTIINFKGTSVHTGKCGDDLVWRLDEETGVFEISGSGEMYGYSLYSVDHPWWFERSSIKTVIVGENVTSIGRVAFYNCDNLKTIDLSKSSVTIINDGAFSDCDGLRGINIPSTLVAVDDSAFEFTTLKYIFYNGTPEDWKKITIGYNNGNFTDVDVCYNVNVAEGVCGEELIWRFYPLSNILQISGEGDMYDFANSDEPGYAAYKDSIKNVIVGERVTGIGDFAFDEYDSIEELTLGSSVKRIGKFAFYGTHIGIVVLPTSVEYIDTGAFPASEYNIFTILYYGSEEQWNSIDNNMGSYYYAYTNAQIVYDYVILGACGDDLYWRLDQRTDHIEITGSGDMYNYSLYVADMPWAGLSVNKITVGDGVTSIGKDAFFGKTSLYEVVLGDSVESIGYEAFYKCSSLKRITLPASLKTVGESAFEGCLALEEIHYGGVPAQWDNINIAASNDPLEEAVIHYSYGPTKGKCGDTLDWSFDEDSGILTLSGNGAMYDYSVNEAPWTHLRPVIRTLCLDNGVTYIGENAFMGCDALEIVKYIGTSDEWSNVEIGKYNDPLEAADVESYIVKDYCGEDITWYFNAFTGELLLEGSGRIPDYNSYPNRAPWKKYYYDILSIRIGDSITEIGDYAFYGLNHAESVEIGSSVEVIGESAFEGCDDLKKVDIPSSVRTIEAYSFGFCNALAAVNFGGSVEHIGEFAFYECTSLTAVELPESLTWIDTSAFLMCTRLAYIVIPDSVTYIGEDAIFNTAYYNNKSNRENDGSLYVGNHFIEAPLDFVGEYNIKEGTVTVAYGPFWGVEELNEVYFPASVTSISDNIFSYCDPFVFICHNGSYAHKYAIEKGIPYDFKCDHVYTDYVSNNDATCVTDGTVTAYCDKGCGMSVTVPDEGSATGIHICGDWYYTLRPTYVSGGTEARDCGYCDFSETRTVDKLSLEVKADNYIVTVNCAEHIKDMRYAPGEHTTPSAIKNTEGNVAISNSLVQKYSKDGIFTYNMPEGGYYTIWVRMTDGTEYILPLDVTHFTPSVSSDGVTVTLHDLYNVKDFYIAEGEYSTYRELKDNGYIFSATSVKIAGRHDYTCVVYRSGVHTVLIRYNDGTQVLFHPTLTVDEPVFTANGLQITVSNIPDVRVIRTAYGEYNTPAEVKRAEGARSFSDKSVIKGRDPYTIQYREEGTVTVTVEYINGYVSVFHYNVTKKSPTVEQSGNKVTFSELEGLVSLRYAQGEYNSSADIKAAPGSGAFTYRDIIKGKISVTLDVGRYTFCVQYDDESYNYYTVIVE